MKTRSGTPTISRLAPLHKLGQKWYCSSQGTRDVSTHFDGTPKSAFSSVERPKLTTVVVNLRSVNAWPNDTTVLYIPPRLGIRLMPTLTIRMRSFSCLEIGCKNITVCRAVDRRLSHSQRNRPYKTATVSFVRDTLRDLPEAADKVFGAKPPSDLNAFLVHLIEHMFGRVGGIAESPIERGLVRRPK